MNRRQALELMGMNLIPPEALAASLGSDYSEEEKGGLEDIPVSESDLLATDPYINQAFQEQKKPLLVKDTHILIPPAPVAIHYFFEKFGFAGEKGSRSGICFHKKSEGNRSWKDWLASQRGRDKERRDGFCWKLIRKSPPELTMGKTYREVLNMLKSGYRPPTFLEALNAVFAYYFWMMDKDKSDRDLKIPFWEERNIWARLLYAKCTWTSDEYETGEKIAVGLNDASGGIYAFPVRPDKISFITGVLPVRDLKS